MKKINWMFGFVIVLVLALTIVTAHTGEDDTGHHGMMKGMMSWWGMSVFGWLFGLLVIAVLVLLIVWLVKQIQKK